MPLEISEIGVHLAIGPAPMPHGGANPASAAQHGGNDRSTAADHDQIVSACVSEVLRVLRMRQER